MAPGAAVATVSLPLAGVARADPELQAAARLLRLLDAATRAVTATLPEGVPHLPAAAARLEAGIAALEGEPLLLPLGLRPSVCALAESVPDPTAERLRAIVEVIESSPEDAEWLAAATIGAAWAEVMDWAERAGLDPELTEAVLEHASRPALRAAAEVVRPVIASSAWSRGICPACGAPPRLAELRGPERERVLRCGRCLTAWAFPRLACPACGERDHRRLGYLHESEQGDYRRADVCDGCKTYLKAVAVLGPLAADALLEQDLMTAGLDFAALERGYRRWRVQSAP
jgi:formate dehydrogenase maturation protein FdhE